MQFEPPQEIIDKITQTGQGRKRVIVAIAGPPGAGKSTVTEALANRLEHAAILPMDGFHLDNDVLRERGLLHRKGAPQTFDCAGMLGLLQRIGDGGDIAVPTFDRAQDRVIPDGAVIPDTARIVLVEGNYLLLDAPGWRDMHRFWDLTIAIDVPRAELERRLVQRWRDHGMSEDDALLKVHENDLPNADMMMERSVKPDLIIRQEENR